MKQFLDVCDAATICLSTMFGISQIENVIGIVVLILQGILLLSKLIYNIVKKVKEKDYQGAIEYIEDVVEDINNFQEEIKKDEK